MPYKSDQEQQFAEWLGEAVKAGLVVEGWTYEPRTHLLIPRQTDEKGRFLFHPTEYTPDFTFELTSKGQIAFPKWAKHMNLFNEVTVDVKGDFDPVRKDDRFVSVMRKLTYLHHQLYVEIVKLPSFFKKTWLPLSMFFTKKTGKPSSSKLVKACVGVDNFVANIKGQQGELL